jgi:hypothetical protein
MEKPKYFDPHKESKFNELHSYCWQCSPSGVRWCLRNGFDPNAEDERGWTPLIWLVRMYDKHTRSRKKMFRWLIKAGAKIDHRATSGHKILELAEGVCSRSFYRFVRSEYKRLTGRAR